MVKKKFEYGIYGVIIGLVVGALLAFGELNWLKKSQRETMLIPVVGFTVLITTVLGYVKGSDIGKTIYIEERLGIDKADHTYGKDGRYWVGTTTWTDQRDGSIWTLSTQRVNGHLCTAFQGQVFRNHGIPNANQDTVPRYHMAVVNEVFEKLRNGFVEGQKQELVL
jgi:hypothetical protein